MITENQLPIECLSEKPTETRKRRRFFDIYARQWMLVALILTDLLSLFTAIFLTLQIRQLFRMAINPTNNQIFGLLAVILVILFYRRGLYPGVGLNYVNELSRIVSSSSAAFLIIFGITFLFKTTTIYSRMIIMVTWVLSLGFIPASRYVVRRLLIGWQLWGEAVVIIGSPKKILPMAEYFKINLQLGLRPTALLLDDECASCVLSPGSSHNVCELKTRARDLSNGTALVLIENLNDVDILVERFRTIFHRIILVKNKDGKFGLSNLEILDFSDLFGLQVKNNLLYPGSQMLKRMIDILASFWGMLFLSPWLGLIALCIKFDSPGGVFYRQVRLGRNGQSFKLLKFRSMYQDADQKLMEELERNPASKDEWEGNQKLKNDPRVTRVGKFLRKFSLDEFPQLWNVVKGEMSLVGPRPIMVNQREMYGESFGDYIQVTPGMTGLWQVSGRNLTTFLQRAEFDIEYIQCWSIWLDIYILVKTIKVVLWRKGAY